MSHWKKHIVLSETQDADAMAGRDGRELAWRTGAMRRLAGVQRGNGGSPQPAAWVQPPWSPGDAVMPVGATLSRQGQRGRSPWSHEKGQKLLL